MNTELIEERTKTHGNFNDNSQISQKLKMIMRDSPSWQGMITKEREALDMIAHKISRICCGDPSFADHWNDIAGYANLVTK